MRINRKHWINNEDAVSVTVGYIIFSAIFLGFFVIVHLSADDLLIDKPSSIVMEEGFSDVGNMIAAKLTDMYLIAPDNGYINTTYRIPETIGGESYVINADVTTMDQIIEITSISGKTVNITISGIANVIPVNGTATSSISEHRISYDSRR